MRFASARGNHVGKTLVADAWRVPAGVFFLLFLNELFMYVFLAALGLRCCTWAFSICSEQGSLQVRCAGFSEHWLGHCDV